MRLHLSQERSVWDRPSRRRSPQGGRMSAVNPPRPLQALLGGTHFVDFFSACSISFTRW